MEDCSIRAAPSGQESQTISITLGVPTRRPGWLFKPLLQINGQKDGALGNLDHEGASGWVLGPWMGDFIKSDRLDRIDKRHPVSLGKRQGLSTFPLRGRRFRIHGHLGGRRKRPQAGRAAGGRVRGRCGQKMPVNASRAPLACPGNRSRKPGMRWNPISQSKIRLVISTRRGNAWRPCRVARS